MKLYLVFTYLLGVQQNSNLLKVRYRIGIFVKSWLEIPTIINGLGM